MSIPTPPAAFIRPKSYDLDDEATFTAPNTISFTAATGKWTMASFTAHENQLNDVATAIERLFLQDFSGSTLDLESMNVNTAYAPDGTTVLNAGFSISVAQAANAPSSFTVGAMVMSPGLAWSLRTWIRDERHIGTPYVPPTP